MRSCLSREDYQEVYGWFDLATPLAFDCGELCGKKCCSEWDQGVGMYLYPGEEVMFSGDEDWLIYAQHSTADYEFCPEWQGAATFIMCTRPCPRQRRPVECRSFPLTPQLTADGQLELWWDDDGIHLCPLVQAGDMSRLQRKFIQGVRQAWQILLRDPLIRADVAWRSCGRQRRAGAPWQRLFRP